MLKIAPLKPSYIWTTSAGGWLLLFVAVLFVYWPGLNGPFLFDDFGSLSALGDMGGVRNWESFKMFVFGGHAGPTGRPLALLSFLLDGNNWPTDALPFKRTNLLVHCLNGMLIGLIAFRILGLLGMDRQRSQYLALISAACWLLHPFLVSTTLYAVQRMAQLSTLFVLLGITLHLRFRTSLDQNRPRAYLKMSISLVACTVLAVLSKENGALLPLLVGVLEATIFASKKHLSTPLNRYWRIVFLVIPSTAIVLYIARLGFTERFFDIVPPRNFSIYERALTEPRILVDYLKHWFLPELISNGVFQDHFPKSTGLLKPVSTILSIAFHLSIITVCLLKRRHWPLIAFAGLFFYSSHLMESTLLNLELYFEHRNYLAAAFLFLPVIVGLHEKLRRPVFTGATLLLLLVLGGFTRYTANVWESYPKMVTEAARKAPLSARAQQQYSVLLFNSNQHEEALDVVDRAIERMPTDTGMRIWRASMRCNLGELNISEFDSMAQVVSTAPYDLRNLKLFEMLTAQVIERRCSEVSLADLRRFFDDMLTVPLNRDPQQSRFHQIKFFVGVVDIHLGEPHRAAQSFQQSLESRPDANRAMLMAALMASNEYYDEALRFSNIAMTRLSTEKNDYRRISRVTEHEIREFQAQVAAEISARQDNGQQ